MVNECVSNCPWQLRESQTDPISLGKNCCRGSRIIRHTLTPLFYLCVNMPSEHIWDQLERKQQFHLIVLYLSEAFCVDLQPHHHLTATRDDASLWYLTIRVFMKVSPNRHLSQMCNVQCDLYVILLSHFPSALAITVGLKLCWQHRRSVWLVSEWWHHPGNYWTFLTKHNTVALRLCVSPQEQEIHAEVKPRRSKRKWWLKRKHSVIAGHVEQPQLLYTRTKSARLTKEKQLSLWHYLFEIVADLELQIIFSAMFKRKTALLSFLPVS